LDSSPAMITRASDLRSQLEPQLAARVRFERGDFHDFQAHREYTLVFSNAALQWTPDQRRVFAAAHEALKPGGWLVTQIPSNEIETAQRSMMKLAESDRWRAKFVGVRLPGLYVLPLDDYRRVLADVGFVEIDCYYHIFEHPMTGPSEVIEWSRAT